MKQADNHPWRAVQADKPETRGPRPAGRPVGLGAPEILTANLREAFEHCGLSKCEVARRLGWLKQIPNIHRLNETLGYEPNSAGRMRRRVTYRTAKRLALAMGCTNYFDLGL